MQVSFRLESLSAKVPSTSDDSYSLRCAGAGYGSGGSFAASATYSLSFQGDDPTLRYFIIVNLEGEQGAGGGFTATKALAYLCLQPLGGNGPLSRNLFSWLSLKVDEPGKALHVEVPKIGLLGLLPSFCGDRCDKVVVKRPIVLGVGSKLKDFQAQALAGWRGIQFGFESERIAVDEAPATPAPEYALRTPFANQHVALHILAPPDGVPVVPGGNQSIKARVVNRMEGKRLLQFTLGFEGEAAGWKVSGPASLALAPNTSRDVYITVESPSAVTSPGPRLVVLAMSVGRPDEQAFVSVPLIPQVALDPKANALFLQFHPRPGRFFGLPGADTFCEGPWPVNAQCFVPVLSTSPDDARARPGNRARTNFFFGAGGMTAVLPWAELSPRLAAPIAFEPNGKADVHLRIQSTAPIDGVTFTARIDYTPLTAPGERDASIRLGDGTVAANIATGASTIIIPVRLAGGPAWIPTLGGLRFSFLATVPEVPGGAIALVASPEVLGKETKIVLPLIEPPAEALSPSQGSPFQIALLSDQEEFVNPGEARLFNVSLINQAAVAQRAKISLEVSPPTWSSRILPGDAFDLEPGDALLLGALLYSPRGAPEGERGTAWLNASAPGMRTASLRLSAISQAGVDVRDDSAAYQPDADTADRLVKQGERGTPSVPLALVLAAVAFPAALVRRMRRPTE